MQKRTLRLLMFRLGFLLLAVHAGVGHGWQLAGAHAQTASPSFDACADLSEEELRDELNLIAQEVFGESEAALDLEAVVARQWTALGLDARFDAAVDEAVRQVQLDEDALDTFLSGWSPVKAEELTARVASAAFGSETFRAAVDELAAGVAGEIETHLAALAAESVSLNLLCLRRFIDHHYSQAVVDAFAADVQAGAARIDHSESTPLEAGILTVVEGHKSALGGIGVIIAAQLARRLAVELGKTLAKRVTGRVAARVLGRVGTELIPLVGWIVGGGLIVYDVIQSRDGALPFIQESLKTEEVRAEVREQLVAAIGPELRRELPQTARGVANELHSEWLDFKRKYRQVLDLAEADPVFAEALAAADDLAASAGLIDVALATVGRQGLDVALASGQLERLLALPPDGVAEILAVTGSIQTVLDWAALAGSDLDQVVALEIHKHKRPEELTKDLLKALLALDDREVVAKLSLASSDELAALLSISSANLKTLSRELTADDLQWLARGLAGLDGAARNQLVTLLVTDPAAVDPLRRPGVWELATAGGDVRAALAFLAAPAAPAADAAAVAAGAASLRLFSAKYGWWAGALLVLLPLLLVVSLVALTGRLVLGPIGGLAGRWGRRRRWE